MAMLDMSVNNLELVEINTQLSRNLIALNDNINNLDVYLGFIENNFEGTAMDKYLVATWQYAQELKKLYDGLLIERNCIENLFSAYDLLDVDFLTILSNTKYSE